MGSTLFVLACLTLGWIVPLVIGAVRLRRSRSDPVGLAMTTVGRVWCVGGLVLGVCGGTLSLMFSFVEPIDQIEQFDPTQYEGPMGALVVPYEGEATLTVAVSDDGEMLELSADDGRFLAPVGEYAAWTFAATKTDEDGSDWQATAFLISDEPLPVSVRADSETALEIGPPFTASIVVNTKARDLLELDLEITDSQGHQYSIYSLGLQNDPPHCFEARTSSGELVLTGEFEYG